MAEQHDIELRPAGDNFLLFLDFCTNFLIVLSVHRLFDGLSFLVTHNQRLKFTVKQVVGQRPSVCLQVQVQCMHLFIIIMDRDMRHTEPKTAEISRQPPTLPTTKNEKM
jgi:hypothetical protein